MSTAGSSPDEGLTYPFAEPPPFGEAMTVAPGVLWIRLPMPLDLDHINVWMIEDGDGYALVDTGLCTDDAPARWQYIAERYLSGRAVGRVVVTHAHPDHIGMAGWFADAFQSELWITPGEYDDAGKIQATRSLPPSDAYIEFYRRAGWSAAALGEIPRNYGNTARWMYPLPRHYRAIGDGEIVMIGGREWCVVTGSGHSKLHACLHCPDLGLFISGDQVLPRISSNVSVLPANPDDDPLTRWYASLSKLRLLIPDDVLVLPAHNTCFYGLHARLDCLKRGHDAALGRLLGVLDQPRRVTETFHVLFRREITEGSTLRLATGEALAHLNYLRYHGKVTCTEGSDGVARYVRRA